MSPIKQGGSVKRPSISPGPKTADKTERPEQTGNPASNR